MLPLKQVQYGGTELRGVGVKFGERIDQVPLAQFKNNYLAEM